MNHQKKPTMAFVSTFTPPLSHPLSNSINLRSPRCPRHFRLSQQHSSSPIPTRPQTTSSLQQQRKLTTTTKSRNPDGKTIEVDTYDVLVVGAGPAGLSLASHLGKLNLSVLIADPTIDKPWPNNYGTWYDDLNSLNLSHCASHIWEKTTVYMSSSKTNCNRAYTRVDRQKLKAHYLDECIRTRNVSVLRYPVQSIDTASNSKVTYAVFKGQDEKIAAKVVVDATGHDLKFVKFEDEVDNKGPGYQAAYGIECTVEGTHSFPTDEMLLMDFRDDHMQSTDEDKKQSQKEPTFLYVMPFDDEGIRVFFEETSLVRSPALPFESLKERLYKRLSFLGISIKEVHDEEFCLIPMGGPKPNVNQRTIAFGGSAAFVHPATGYMIARALSLSKQVASIINAELLKENEIDADEISSKIWNQVWTLGRQRQRDFLNFGGEYLMNINLNMTRDFFDAFFKLPKQEWAAFLSFGLVMPIERLKFGLGVFWNTSNRVRLSLIREAIVNGQWPLIRSVLPLYEVERDDELVSK